MINVIRGPSNSKRCLYTSFVFVNFTQFSIEVNISSHQVHFNQMYLLRTEIIIKDNCYAESEKTGIILRGAEGVKWVQS